MPQYRIKQIAEFNITSPSADQTLRYDGSGWVNTSGLIIESDGDVTVSGSLVVQGNYTVNGTTSTINTENLLVEDPIILLSSTQSGTPTLDSGIFINRGTSATQSLLWDESADQFAFISTSDSAETQGSVTIDSYSSLRVGGFQLTDGSESDGYFLVSDANGVGSWTSSSSSFDDLTDVSVSGASINHTLRYSGSSWVNSSEILSHSDGTMSVSGRLGVGVTSPTANLNTRGTILFESTSGIDRYVMNEDGQTALAAGTSAAIQTLFGHFWRTSGYSYGFGFYPNNATTQGVTIQMLGTTDIGLGIANQGNPTGTVYGIQSSIFSNAASTNIAIHGNGRNGSLYSIGIDGAVSGGNSVAASQYVAAVRGSVSYNLDGDAYGGRFTVIPGSGSIQYTNNNYYGVFGSVGGNYDQTSSGLTFYGGKFESDALLHTSTQYGIHSTVTVSALYGTVSAVAGYFSSNADGAGSTNYAIIVPSGGGQVGIGTSIPDEQLHIVGNMKYVDGNQADGYILTSDANGVASWTASSAVVSGDGNGIFDVSNDGGTIPTAFDTNLTDAWNLNQPSSSSGLNVRNITSGNANLNITSDGTADGQAILKIDAQGANRDSYIHFANTTTYHTIGLDSSDSNKFKIGTTAITVNTVLTIDTSQNVGIGTTNPLYKLNVRGDGGDVFLVENSAGGDILNMYEDGSTVFNSSGLPGGDFTIEGDTDTVLFKTDAGLDTVGIGVAPTSSDRKLWVDATNETRTFIAVFGSNTAQNGVSISTTGTNSDVFGLQSTISTSNASGTARGGYFNSIGASGANNYGVYARTGNASNQNIALYGQQVFAGGSGLNAGVYGLDSSSSTIEKHGVYGGISGGLSGTTTTTYALRARNSNGANNSDNYGLHSEIALGGGVTGSTNYAGYFDVTAVGSGNTNYGIVVGADLLSGIGTIAPTETLHVNGTFRLVDGTQADGYILTSDANGVASWTASSGGGGSTVSSFTDLSDVTITSATLNDTLIYDGSDWVNTSNVTIDANGTMSVVGHINTNDHYRIENVVVFDIEQGSNGNLSVGERAMDINTISGAIRNTAIGYDAGAGVTSGDSNTLIGWGAGRLLDTESNNTVVGSLAMYSHTGQQSIAIGTAALDAAGSGSGNVAVGYQALSALADTSTDNIGIGRNAMFSMPDGSFNIAIGGSSGPSTTGGISNSISFGRSAIPDASNQGLMGGELQRISEFIIGAGPTTVGTGAVDTRIRSTDIADGETDKSSGYTTYLSGTRGTGTGDGGDLILQTAPAGSTGTSQNSYFDSVILDGSTGNVGIFQSSPTEPLHVDGNVRINDLLKIGTSGTSLTSTGVVTNMIASDSNTSTTTLTTVGVEMTINPSSNNSSFFKAINGGILKNGSNNAGTVWGVGAYSRNSGTGNITNLIGVDGFAWSTNTSASITNLFGFRARPQTQGGSITDFGGLEIVLGQSTAGTITNMYGIYVNTPVNTGATVSNTYGLRIDSNYTGSNNYGIYQAGTMSNYFGGNVGIGTTSPSETLHVDGSFRYVDGNEANGYVLTSDINGVATWQASGGGGSIDKYVDTATFSAGITQSVNHTLDTDDVLVQCYDSSGLQITPGSIEINGTSSVDIFFSLTQSSVKTVIVG
ncbi:MAG: hypothetical protein SLAVMIC_00657 [uncultured marine phage]|uniref:Uncharacterized protein n=1 Tax=uncultured marine phage TaxID=707152 RepID=A0A8D9FQZ3_9VIRU|nr:MAG: hypothetical protein SLAVMIC_00657 [uncultured marine phage]